uniref:Uncharacterized protein n=1 Tax=Oryza nivara TaxID=4536 RepID=A0A0E0GKP1_ORYNI
MGCVWAAPNVAGFSDADGAFARQDKGAFSTLGSPREGQPLSSRQQCRSPASISNGTAGPADRQGDRGSGRQLNFADRTRCLKKTGSSSFKNKRTRSSVTWVIAGQLKWNPAVMRIKTKAQREAEPFSISLMKTPPIFSSVAFSNLTLILRK